MSSSKDLSILSYKELQALAVKHRVPGNIKKLLLVKVLHAIRNGNNSEVTKLLTDLKKNRKKRTKKLKTPKVEEDNKALQPSLQNSNLFSHQDNHYFPMHNQQQYALPWIGSEEEVEMNKYDDTRHCNLSYSDIRQFVFYSTQGAYSNSDTNNNNNSSLPNEIMDLRTETTVSNYRSSLDVNAGNTDQHQQYIPQPVDDCTNKKMSLLLKKMLQAPVGANLGEIASPVPNWPSDVNQTRADSPDNSDTMTAKSDINENDDIWQDNLMPLALPWHNMDCDQNYNDSTFYRRSNNESFYKSSLDNVQNTLQGYDQQSIDNQYQFSLMPLVDSQKNCQNWLATTGFNMQSSPDYDANIFTRSESTEVIIPCTSNSSNIVQQNDQYCFNDNTLYTDGDLDVLSSVEYESTPNIEQSTGISNFNKIEQTTSFSSDSYVTSQHQPDAGSNQNHSYYTSQYSSTPVYQVELDSNNTQQNYDSGFYQEQPPPSSLPSTNQHMPLEPLQQVQEQPYENYVVPTTTANPPPSYSSSVLDSYWPRWTQTDQSSVNSRSGGRSLENTLNLCTPNYVDYKKLNATCCVYSNKTPVMTLRRGLNSSSQSLALDRTCGGSLLQLENSEVKNSFQQPPQQPSQQQTHPQQQQQLNFNASNWLLYAGGSVETSSTYVEEKVGF